MAPATSAALTIHPLTPNRWDDFEALFGKNGACAGCWCTWWRMGQSEWLAKKGDGTKKEMRALVKKGPPPGLLEGYPTDTDKEQPAAFVYHGLLGAFRKAGFREVVRRSKSRPIVRRKAVAR